MRKSLIVGIGVAAGTALLTFAMPTIASATTPSGAASPSTGSSSTASSPSSSSPAPTRYKIGISPSRVVRGGTVTITLEPGVMRCMMGTISSDAFETILLTPHQVVIRGDALLVPTIRADARLGPHRVVASCRDGGGQAILTVIAQTSTTPSSGVATGGGGTTGLVGAIQP